MSTIAQPEVSIAGTPELVVEVAHPSRPIDPGVKRAESMFAPTPVAFRSGQVPLTPRARVTGSGVGRATHVFWPGSPTDLAWRNDRPR